jgi:predicted metal-dependent enzyme (double-stranded beta helix superfamily)
MMHTLEQFSAECHRILKADTGPEGRQKVCALVREMCKDEAIIAANLGDDVPDRKILYEDPELGFCILGHVHKDAPGRISQPHDHGPSWAIYGQARGDTIMTDYFPVERTSSSRATPTSTTRATCIRHAARGRPALIAALPSAGVAIYVTKRGALALLRPPDLSVTELGSMATSPAHR